MIPYVELVAITFGLLAGYAYQALLIKHQRYVIELSKKQGFKALLFLLPIMRLLLIALFLFCVLHTPTANIILITLSFLISFWVTLHKKVHDE